LYNKIAYLHQSNGCSLIVLKFNYIVRLCTYSDCDLKRAVKNETINQSINQPSDIRIGAVLLVLASTHIRRSLAPFVTSFTPTNIYNIYQRRFWLFIYLWYFCFSFMLQQEK